MKNKKSTIPKLPKKFNNPKNFKFKTYWIYGIILIFFLGMQVFNFSKPIEKSWEEISLLAESGKIKELHLVKNKIRLQG